MYIKLFKNGQIRIPKKFQLALDFQVGNYLFIYESQNCIMIEKDHHDETLNQCLFALSRISIPMELRRILDISHSTPLSIDVSSNNDILLIKKVGLENDNRI